MLKAQFSRNRVDGYGLAIGAEFCRVKVKHPYRDVCDYQPTFTIALRVWCWEFYFMCYKPAKVMLNRKERRMNKFN